MGERGRESRNARFGTARVYPLGQEPCDDLREQTTAGERLAMVWPLTREAWSLTGRPMPRYERSEVQVRIVKRRGAGPPPEPD